MATSPSSWSSSTGTPRRSAGTSPKRPTASPPPRNFAIHTACGAVRADAARGLLLRHDHGSAFMSDHFQNQIAFLGLTPSFAFVREPETNGVAERFIRTLKEQVVWGRIFRNAEEVRAAVRAFVARYNEHWLLEKNAYRSPA